MKMSLAIAFLMVLVSGSVLADDSQPAMLNKHDFMAMKSQVTKDIAQEKRYKEIRPADLETVKKTLARMEAHWQQAEDASQLTPDVRVEMVNDEQLVDTILEHAELDSRTVCERSDRIGSHMPHTTCKTVAQMKREQEKSQDSMRDGNTGTN